MLMTDYGLTYAGIANGAITEANPLMAWLFELPLSQGLPIRGAMSIMALLPFFILMKRDKAAYGRAILIASALYVPVILLHLQWLITFGGVR